MYACSVGLLQWRSGLCYYRVTRSQRNQTKTDTVAEILSETVTPFGADKEEARRGKSYLLNIFNIICVIGGNFV